MNVSRAALGEFVPAFYAVPQNPVILLPTGRSNGLGDFVRANFTTAPLLPGNAGLGCACGGSCATCSGGRGLSGISDDISAMFDGTAPMTTYLIYGGGALALLFLLGSLGTRSKSNRSGYRAAKRQALARLREQYPTRGRAVRRAVSGAAEHF